MAQPPEGGLRSPRLANENAERKLAALMAHRRVGQYEIVRRLGEGAGGVAYLGRDTRLERPVVLKLLHRGHGGGPKAKKASLREARLASAIEHPNVCTVYDVVEESGEAFIVMQHVPGRNLRELMRESKMPLPLVLSVGVQAADGLDAAHRLGIVHRDLKPENIMLTDGGLVKILDFGLAQRITVQTAAGHTSQPSPDRRSPTGRGGTVAYMAPELFVTGEASERSDVFSLGVMLYEMATGRHPFRRSGDAPAVVAGAIQFQDPDPPSALRGEIPPELAALIVKCLAKTPSERLASAADLREALRTILRSRGLEPLPGAEAPKAPPAPAGRTGFLAMLAERFMRHADLPATSITVLPFRDLKPGAEAPLYGLALADAVAARLSRLPSVVVRPASSLVARPEALADPLRAGKELMATYVVAGTFLQEQGSFNLNWQLLEVATGAMRSGGMIAVHSLDLIVVQDQIGQDVFATLRGTGGLLAPLRSGTRGALEGPLSERYLEGRARLSHFLLRSNAREDLHRAQDGFAAVLEQRPDFAPAHSALGVTHLQYVRGGFGGRVQLMAAQQCFDEALAIDPGLVEADLYRVLTLLARGEKEAARRGIQRLLQSAPNDFDVRLVAAVILRLDGLFDLALRESGAALALNPAGAVLVYDHRARVHHYEGRLELAMAEVQKGLALEQRHPRLRTSLGYLLLRRGDASLAAATLESVLVDAPELHIARPTLALAYLAQGEVHRAERLVTEDVLVAADADGEMAYRLATQFAFGGSEFEALHWLRKAIYLGNENFPWFARNPAWNRLRGREDVRRVLMQLERSWQANRRRWRRLA